MRRLSPVSGAMREQFGMMNAGLDETITGIEVVKSTAQEEQEQRKFERNAAQLPRLLRAQRARSRRATCRCCCSRSALVGGLSAGRHAAQPGPADASAGSSPSWG